MNTMFKLSPNLIQFLFSEHMFQLGHLLVNICVST
jgi:hypothetical protein